MATEPRAAVDLYWLPLGAGGHFVRMNGRIYEALAAWRSKRQRRALYHSALIVTVPAGQFVIEQSWPIPSGDTEQRGVVAEGPVGTQRARSLRFLRYEIRRWRDGLIADLDEAVDSPQRLTEDVVVAERLLELVPEVPTPVWGRDEFAIGEMWNSNSLISWLVARSGLDVESVHPPAGGRAPGWDAGVTAARRQATSTPDLPQPAVAATLDALPKGDRMSGVATAMRPPSARVGGVAWLVFIVGMWIAFFLALLGDRLGDIWQWARDLPLVLEFGLWLLMFPWLLGTAVWESSWAPWLRVCLVASFAVGWTLISIPRAKEPRERAARR
jgi:hypothetical protein